MEVRNVEGDRECRDEGAITIVRDCKMFAVKGDYRKGEAWIKYVRHKRYTSKELGLSGAGAFLSM